MNKFKFILLMGTTTLFVALASLYAADWGDDYISHLSSGDCKGIASGDKSWCTSSQCKAIASHDKSWCP